MEKNKLPGIARNWHVTRNAKWISAISLSTYALFYVCVNHVPAPTLFSAGKRKWFFVTPQRPRKILLWTTFFERPLAQSGPGQETRVGSCEHLCYATHDRTQLSSSDAVVFHVQDLNPSDLPPSRTAEQKWVFWSLESPHHTRIKEYNSVRSVFNWTMTYRLDSDVHLPYGSYRKRTTASSRGRNVTDVTRNKTKTAVWVASNCVTPSKREGFVKELQKYVDIDVYGKCGELQCPFDDREECFRKFERYYFWLALENSLCRDYVTEKLFSALNYNIIPVVRGDANYSALAPPDSVIDASSFASPRDLVSYLARVRNDAALYDRYLRWKDDYDIVIWHEAAFCALCGKLHSREFAESSSYEDIESWWVNQSRCRS